MLKFIEPAPNRLLVNAVQAVLSRYARLTSSHLRLSVSTTDTAKIKCLGSHPTLICPNHADPDDPMVMFGLSAECHEHFAFLTAREIFKHYPSLSALWLQYLGCYSVVRAATDIESYKASLDLLLRDKAKIVIFPEGEISHQNMHLCPLEDGPELLAITAAMRLSNKKPDSAAVWIVPVALLYRYESSSPDSFNVRLEQVEHALQLNAPSCGCVPHRLKACFVRLIRMMGKAGGFELPPGDSFNQLKSHLLAQTIAESPYANQAHLPDFNPTLANIHKLKNSLNEKRFRKGLGKITSKDRELYHGLKSITNLFSIEERSFDHSVSLEEVGELLTVLQEEVLRQHQAKAPRVCHIGIGEPIDVRQYIAGGSHDREAAVLRCKTDLAERLSTKLVELSEQHPTTAVFHICHKP